MDFRPPELDFADGGPIDAPPVLDTDTPLELDFPLDLDLDVSLSASDSPIELDELEVRRLMSRLRLDLSHARDKKRRVDDRAFQDRQAYDLDEKIQEYEGQPNITMPSTRAKTDSVVGHLVMTVDQEPFFAATSHTPEAVEVAPIYETALERELQLADSSQQLLMAIKEAATVGTAIIGFELVERPSGELAVQLKLTRVENFACYPAAVDDFSQCTTFRRFKLPYWKLRELAREGMYDMVAVLALRGTLGGENLTKEESDDASGGDSLFDENRMVELYEAFYRYAPSATGVVGLGGVGETTLLDGGEAVLWQVIFNEQHPDPLVVRENPYRTAFDAPPYVPVRLDKKAGYIWGTSVPTLMRAPQKIMDDAMNDGLAYNQLARTPAIEADRNSSLFRTYGENGYKLRPGDLIPRSGPQNSGVNVLQFPQPDGVDREIAIAQEMGDLVTFNDHMLQGDNYAAGRRTKYEVQSAYGSSATKLKNYLRTLAADSKLLAKYCWAMLDAFKVEPEGVYSVYKDGTTSLLSADGIPAETVQAELQAMLPELLQDPATAQEAAQRIVVDARDGRIVETAGVKLVGGAIPSTRRDDITFGLTGTSISADRVASMQQIQAFAPFMNLLPYAQQDSRVWYFLKRLTLALDLLDGERLIGQDPQKMDLGAFQQAMMMQQESVQKSAQL